MTLDHVHQCARMVVVARSVLKVSCSSATTSTHDVLIAPDRLEEPIGKTHTDQIQHRRAPRK